MRRIQTSDRSKSYVILLPLLCSLLINALSLCHSIGSNRSCQGSWSDKMRSTGYLNSKRRVSFQFNMIYAPPGSGYYRPEDETSYLPQTYDPMMEYPGTMRPGRTKENQPYSSLPIADNDPDPVPWPHFQEIEWHHQWTPPHEHPIPMEEFIEMEGRWATAEMEAEMRVGARRGVRERREMEEMQKSSSNFILDDDDDDDGEDLSSPMLGDGIELMIGSKASGPSSAADVKKRKPLTKSSTKFPETEDEDDFLLDLGLGDDDIDGDFKGVTKALSRDLTNDAGLEKITSPSMRDLPAGGDIVADETSLDLKFDDFDLDFSDEGGDVDDMTLNIAGDMDLEGGDEEVQLDDFVGNEDIGDDNYGDDDGGYDYGFNYDDNDDGSGEIF